MSCHLAREAWRHSYLLSCSIQYLPPRTIYRLLMRQLVCGFESISTTTDISMTVTSFKIVSYFSVLICFSQRSSGRVIRQRKCLPFLFLYWNVWGKSICSSWQEIFIFAGLKCCNWRWVSNVICLDSDQHIPVESWL